MYPVLLQIFVPMLMLTLPAASTSIQPNILMIMADDLGWNDVSFKGSEISTPNIDKLADNGVILNNYYTAPNCGPSRAQFLTGKYLTHLGLQHKNLQPCRPSGIPLSETTIADELKTLGYKSHLIGKWHGGFHTSDYLPTNRGFDSFRGMLNGQGDHFLHTKPFRGNPVLDFYNDTTPYAGAAGIYSTDYYERRAHEVIDEHSQSGRPMFMFLSFQAPHTPNQAPQKYIDQYSSIRHKPRRNYAAMVTAMDDAIGSVMKKLSEQNMTENTVIVFSTDNGGQALSGGASNFPLRGNKGNYYEAGIKGIALMSSPLIKNIGMSNSLVHISDWKPTFVHMAGGKLREDHDGVNQWETLTRGAEHARTEIIYNIDPLSLSGRGTRRSGRRGRSVTPQQSPEPSILNFFSTTPRTTLGNTQAADLPINSFGTTASNAGALGVSFEQMSTTTEQPIQPFNLGQLAAIRSGDWKLMTGQIGFSGVVPNPTTDPIAYKFARGRKRLRPSVRLFNITEDPTESHDMSFTRPDIVLELIEKLRKHQQTALTPFYPSPSSLCRPQLFENIEVWGPYSQ